MSIEKLAVDGGTPVRTTGFPGVADISGRDFGDEEIELLTQVIRSGKLGRWGATMVAQFEKEFCELLGMKHAVASTSGTSALHVAVGAVNPNPGDEIITCPITDAGSIIPILMQNAVPVFADLDPDTYTPTAETIAAKITARTKAVMVIQLFGQMADMGPIVELCKSRGLILIEDCCQAYLAEYKGNLSGTMGDIGCFSLQQSKHMSSGDGGVTVTNNPELARRMLLFHDKGWPRDGSGRDYMFLGPNYRMNELTGAVALAQTRKVRKNVELRRKWGNMLSELIKDIPGINACKVGEGRKHSYWLYPMTIEEDVLGVSPAEFCKILSKEGIGAGNGYIGKPIYNYEFLRDRNTYGDSHFPLQDTEYKLDDCPKTVEALRRLNILSINEKYVEQDVLDMAAGIRKVATALAARK